MDAETSNNKLLAFIIECRSGIAAILAATTAIFSAYKAVQGDVRSWLLIFLAVSLLYLWYYSFQILLLKYKHPAQPGFVFKEQVQKYAYPTWARIIALLSIFGIPLLVIVGFATSWVIQNLPPSKLIVLVADFDGPEPSKYRVTESIIEQLRSATTNDPDVDIEPLGEVVTAQQGSRIARERGADHKASIVLWGWYGQTSQAVSMNVHFELLHKPELLTLTHDTQNIVLPVAELESFSVQTKLSKEMSYLTLLTLGVARFEINDLDRSIARFDEAISAGSASGMANPADVYYFRGSALYRRALLGASSFPAQARADFSEAIRLNPDYLYAYMKRSSVRFIEGDLSGAVADCDQMIRIDPEFQAAYMFRGLSHMAADQQDLAAKDFDCISKFEVKDAMGAYMHAFADMVQANFGSAIKALDQALELEEGDDELRPLTVGMRGLAKAMAEDPKGAIRDLTEAIEARPDYLGFYYYRARVFIHDNQYKSGIEDLSYLIDHSSTCFGAYYFRGVAYQESDDFSAAIRDLQTYLSKTGGINSNTIVIQMPPDAIDDARQRLRDLGAAPD